MNNSTEKHGSFIRHRRRKSSGASSHEAVQKQQEELEKKHEDHQHVTSPEEELSFREALQDVDQFVKDLSEAKGGGADGDQLEVPGSMADFFKIFEKTIAKNEYKIKFGQSPKDDATFIEALIRASKLVNVLESFSINSSSKEMTSCLNKASTMVHLAMSFLDGEFRAILESYNHDNHSGNINNNNGGGGEKAVQRRKNSFGNPQHDQELDHEDRPIGEELFLGYSSEAMSKLNVIATAMICSGYEKECFLVYGSVRRKALDKELANKGFQNTCFEDVHRMQWQSLEAVITTWISVIKHCSSELFPSERKLCESVFADINPSLAQEQFGELATTITIRFLNFAEAIVLTKRSAEKLFKFLDMYETISEMVPFVEDNCSSKAKSETWAAKSHLGEAAVSSFCDLENSIRRDNGRTPVPSGAVHPLTRYTMNYLKYACEYRDTLEQVFQHHQKMEGSTTTEEADSNQEEMNPELSERANEDGTPKTSPFAVQLNMVMDLLDENLDMKSKLYRDPALKSIFLMNNGRYILQKIKSCPEIHGMMGDNWCRKRSTHLRQYHKGYTRETWSKLLQCLSHEGLLVGGKVVKPMVKERFKMFNNMFDEIHRTQTTWVVSDEQLQSELRVSVCSVVIPAYRSFLGRFQQYLASGRQSEKYIKYQPEDIENLIDDLFSGNPTSMARKKI